MTTPHHAIAGLWRSLLWKLESHRAVEAFFWRLPYELRRRVVRACRIDVAVPQHLVAEILSRKVLFIHLPKTAGLSVQQSLFGRAVFHHQAFRQYELVLGEEVFASLFKFTFVRNPWDRLVSAWTYLRDGGHNEEDKAWFAEHAACFPDFESFVLKWLPRQDLPRSFVHFKPQASLLRSTRGKIEMDFVGRFENLACDFQQVAQRLKCAAPLESHNRTQSRQSPSYRPYYSPKTAEIVAKAYEDDVRTFGYQF